MHHFFDDPNLLVALALALVLLLVLLRRRKPEVLVQQASHGGVINHRHDARVIVMVTMERSEAADDAGARPPRS